MVAFLHIRLQLWDYPTLPRSSKLYEGIYDINTKRSEVLMVKNQPPLIIPIIVLQWNYPSYVAQILYQKIFAFIFCVEAPEWYNVRISNWWLFYINIEQSEVFMVKKQPPLIIRIALQWKYPLHVAQIFYQQDICFYLTCNEIWCLRYIYF